MRKNRTIGILIPAHNEEKIITRTIHSCLTQTRPADQIVVVNDGSTDRTQEILEQFGDKITVVRVPRATGNKSRAQAIGIQALTTDIFIATDGDTLLHPDFVLEIEKSFQDPAVHAVAGYVQSLRYNVLTALREIEYVVAQDLFKLAQSRINYVLIVPGCAGAYYTHLFRNGTLTFEHDTLTEDLDITYKLHQQHCVIAYNQNALVYTQDPPSLHSYINQMRRWYAGGWQNLLKHYRVLSQPNASLALTLSYCESLLFACLFFLLPILDWHIYLYVLLFNTIAIMIAGAYAAWQRNRIELFLYSPLRVGMQYINSYLFIEQFYFEVLVRKHTMHWFKPERRTLIHPPTV